MKELYRVHWWLGEHKIKIREFQKPFYGHKRKQSLDCRIDQIQKTIDHIINTLD